MLRFLLSASPSLTTGSVVETPPLCPSAPPLLGVADDVLPIAFHLGKVKFQARHSPVDVLDVVAGGLKVCRGVVRAGDKDLERAQSQCWV